MIVNQDYFRGMDDAMLNTAPPVDRAGGERFDPRRVLTVVEAAHGRTDTVDWDHAPVRHHVDNMTTHALDRVQGRFADGSQWSLIAKTLHPASESPYFEIIPEEHHADTLAALNWRDEPTVYRCGLAARLPGVLRMPIVHAIDESPTRITIWMEDVADSTAWDIARYRRTAEALGRLTGAWTAAQARAQFALGHREIGDLFFGKVVNFDLQVQADDAFWSQPHVAEAVDAHHRRDLFELAAHIPAMLARLEDVPRGVCHGDACPGNFIEPADGSVVALDWAFGNIDAHASDLGQLLAGRYESGAAEVADLEAISRAIFEGYRSGLDAEGVAVEPSVLERSWATHLAIRSVFSAMMIDHLPGVDDDQRFELAKRRAALGRFGLDLALQHV